MTNRHLYPFRDRNPSPDEVEALRLVLSVYRDGSGQNQTKYGSMPGWRDFERAIASVIGGEAPEGKGVFDVIRVVPESLAYGISCKMARFSTAKVDSAFVEVSNSASKFRKHLLDRQINWVTEPGLAMPAIIKLVGSWHTADSLQWGIDPNVSKYLVLSRNSKWDTFRLSVFPLSAIYAANPIGEITWTATNSRIDGDIEVDGQMHRLWQWYPNSGGQLKWWPLTKWAEWTSKDFTLEEPPQIKPTTRAADYFPTLWPKGFTPA